MRKIDWSEVDWAMWACVAIMLVWLVIVILVAFALAPRIAPVA